MMQRAIRTIDYHLAGEPLRIVLGRQVVEGCTMAEKAANGETILGRQRDFLVTEPRGHAEMFGAFLTDPVSAGSAFGCCSSTRPRAAASRGPAATGRSRSPLPRLSRVGSKVTKGGTKSVWTCRWGR
ncbi:hypothetical protein FJ546_20735 [Mesorhizobium sp. B2-4-19]|nr:hypothetical protein FJ546_20735 [Mesorhizobium sp. B2-4-19]